MLEEGGGARFEQQLQLAPRAAAFVGLGETDGRANGRGGSFG